MTTVTVSGFKIRKGEKTIRYALCKATRAASRFAMLATSSHVDTKKICTS